MPRRAQRMRTTTATRMDPFTPILLHEGLAGMIGKGRRSRAVVEAIKETGAVYFYAFGGCGALYAERVRKSEVAAFADLGPERSFAMLRSVGDAFLSAWLPIAQARRNTPYGERERAFQAYRRGRYVEFNLVWDRGTLFGLQSGGRIESILMSMPPQADWRYQWTPEPGSAEERLYTDFLRPRDWVQGG